MNTMHRVSVILVTAVLAIASAHAADTKAPAFPIGSYQSGPNIVVFNADGTFVGTTPKGEDWVKGTYTHTAKEFTVVDTWEGAAITKDGEDCKGKPGRYAWVKTGKILTAHVVEDPCEGRKHGTDGVAWTQIK
ncbi:hypothetical protein SAMN05428989_3083 [Pseudoxanthomonas sp. GM95]|uniref:hypothetical protein n=1 Tax=Pseudoxanthomonas sp. GM95 TaxID=1881043 RepID=UPI0008BF684F|nr:hypothetical protein [Pseudoxanthomonas sp. GM95]SEM11280.1 hypothetical protein SAMN05428989_3083 [Pseudoxanthomonas sp. GM95]